MEIVRDGRLKIRRQPFGKTSDGKEIDIYLLKNSNGVEIEITNYGGIVVSLKVPDRRDKMADVVLGYDDLASYEMDERHFGAIIGRYANRIAQGKFRLDGHEYTLARNNGPNHLHGGVRGFEKAVWRAREISAAHDNKLILQYISADGEEGYPGELLVRVEYSLGDENEFRIAYSATTDKDTVLSLTNHSYFNLTGAAECDIRQHRLQLNADRFTPVDENLIPTGELRSVAHTPFDFTQPEAIGARIDQDDPQLNFGHGYDHNWVLNAAHGNALRFAALLADPVSGRALEVRTTQPGLQFYSGNFMNGKQAGQGSVYGYRTGLCLETQYFPDSPNQPTFPSTILRPGETYAQKTVLNFRTLKTPPN